MEIIYPKETIKAIHPLGIFREGWGILLEKFPALAGIFLLFNCPASLVTIFLERFLGSAAQVSTKAGIGIFIVQLIALLISSWGAVAAFLLIGKEKGLAESIKEARRSYLPFIGTIILFGLLVFVIFTVGALLAVLLTALFIHFNLVLAVLLGAIIGVPAIFAAVYFSIRLSLGGVVCIMEGTSPIGSLKRSHALIKRYVTPVVGGYGLIFISAILLVLPALFLMQRTQDAFRPTIASYVYSFAANLVLAQLATAFHIVLYRKLQEATA